MMKTLLAGLVFGASLVGGVASADAPFIGDFVVHDDLNSGALWKNNNPQNQDQHGAGCEHSAITYLKSSNRILMTCTGSFTDITPAMTTGFAATGAKPPMSSTEARVLPPKDADQWGRGTQEQGERVQGYCVSYKPDAQMGLIKTNEGYYTNNASNDWRNAHKPAAYSIDGGNAAVVLYGYAPNNTNNTATYSMVLGPNCEMLSTQTLQVAKTNDNVGGLYEGGFARDNADGTSDAVFGMIGNGNGDDNGWIAKVHITKAADGTYTVKKTFDQTVVQNEERSRGTIVETTDPNHILVIYAEGNAQPPNNGVRMSYVNVADANPTGTDPENAAGGRIEWRQYLMQRQGNIYYTTPSMTPVRDASGAVTNNYIANWVMVDTTNRQGRQKGRTEIQTAPVQISTTGVTMLDQPKAGMFGLTDGSHPGMVEGTYGADKRPVAFMFSGSITDGGAATVKVIGMDATSKLEPIRALNWAPTTSAGYSSQWYGQNPNTAQGRTYPPHGIILDNPGYGQVGGYQSTVKSFLIVSHAHHMDHTGDTSGLCTGTTKAAGTQNGTCGGKNAMSLVMIPVNADATTGGTGSNDPVSNPDPNQPTGGDGGSEGATTLGGCSTTGTSSGAGSLVLLGLALVTIRRRRAN
jgi:MYXO-CTERM domain-containing protein